MKCGLRKGGSQILRLNYFEVRGHSGQAVIRRATAERFPKLFASPINAFLKEPKFNVVNSDVAKLNWVMMRDTPGISSRIGNAGDALRGWLLDE